MIIVKLPSRAKRAAKQVLSKMWSSRHRLQDSKHAPIEYSNQEHSPSRHDAPQAPDPLEAPSNSLWLECRENVQACFPDMCPDHLTQIATQFQWEHARIIDHVLDEQDRGNPYPTRSTSLKRKREPEDKGESSDDIEKLYEGGAPRQPDARNHLYMKQYFKAAYVCPGCDVSSPALFSAWEEFVVWLPRGQFGLALGNRAPAMNRQEPC
jgi:hypothetical protein